MVASYLEYEWQKINTNRTMSATLTIGVYENPSDITDIRYCRCMGKGKIDSIKGTTDTNTTVPEIISAFGEFTKTASANMYIQDENIPSLKEADKINVQITKPNGEIISVVLSYVYREPTTTSDGRKVYRLDGHPFNFSELVGQDVTITVSW